MVLVRDQLAGVSTDKGASKIGAVPLDYDLRGGEWQADLQYGRDGFTAGGKTYPAYTFAGGDVVRYYVYTERSGNLLTAAPSVILPADPVREGYTFTGWYLDAACTHLFSVDALDGFPLTLYAGWTPVGQ